MIRPLTSLRFVFAFMVFLYHLPFLEESPNNSIGLLYEHVFAEGYIGVSFFIILSGFILAYNYEYRILESVESVSKFISARIARIYPLHFLTMLAAIPLVGGAGLCCLESEKVLFLNTLGNVFMLHGFFPDLGKCCYLNGPSWSISVEFFFYGTFPILIYFTRGFLGSIGRSIGFMLALLVLICGGMLLFAENLPGSFFYVNPFIRTADFLLGIALYSVYKQISTLSPRINLTLLEVVTVVLFMAFFILKGNVPHVYRYSVYYWIPVCLMILVFAFQGGLISKLLSAKWFIILGEISFAFYMIHQVVLRYMSMFWAPWELTELERAGYAFLVSLIASYLSFTFFEIKVNQWIKKNSLLNSFTTKLANAVFGRIVNH